MTAFRRAVWSLPLLAAAGAFADDLGGRLDHDAFVRALGEQGLAPILEALDRAEPAADPVERLRRRIAVARLPLLAEDRTPPSVAAAAEEAIRLRSELLAAVPPQDPRRLRWLGDQLEDLHRWLIPAEGADLAMRVGVPSAAQAAFAAAWARRGEAWAVEAERLLEAALAADAVKPDTDPAAKRRWDRIVAEARLRVPTLRGISAARAADLLPEAAAAMERRRLAVERLSTAPLPEHPDLAEIAMLQLAMARIGLGQHPPGARDLEAIVANAAVAPRNRFEAGVGLVLAASDQAGAAAALRQLDALRRRQLEREGVAAFLPLWADLEHRLLLESSVEPPAAGSAAWRASLQPYEDLARNTAPAARGAALAAAIGRLAAFAERSGCLDAASIEAVRPTAPLLLLVAIADTLLDESRSGRPGDGDADAAERLAALTMASEAIGEAIAREAAAGELASVSLRTRARCELAIGDRDEAVRTLLDSVRAWPSDPAADAALEAAVAIARTGPRPAGGTPLPLPETLAAAIALGERHPRRDAWRIEAAAIASNAGEFDHAAAMLAEVPPPSAAFLESQVARLENAVRAAEATGVDAPARWLDRAERLLRQLEPWPPAAPEGREPQEHAEAGVRIALARARLHLLANRPAAAIVEITTLREGVRLEPDAQFEALRLRLAALDRLGRREEAAEELRQVAAAEHDRAGLRALLEQRLAESIELALAAEREGDLDRSRSLGRQTIGPLADTLRSLLETSGAAASPAIVLRIAEGLRRGGRSGEALALAATLPETARDSMEAVRLQAECRFAQGRLEDLAAAMPLYRRLAASAPPQSDAWWLAELRTLEILDRVGRDADRIPPRIARLRAIDPGLGHEGYRRAFEALLLRR